MEYIYIPGWYSRTDALSRDAVKQYAMETSDMEGLETVEEATVETEESTTATTEVQDLQHQLEQELKRHDDTLKYYQQRIKDEQGWHSKVQQELEAKLLQALAESESTQADGDYWLNNRVIPEATVSTKKLTSTEKTLIRAKVKKDYYKKK